MSETGVRTKVPLLGVSNILVKFSRWQCLIDPHEGCYQPSDCSPG